jgi:hypothetical protein
METPVLERRSKEETPDHIINAGQAEALMTTKEFAGLLRVEPATVRRGLCVNGHYLSVKPVKLSNGRLLWPRNDALKIIRPGSDPWGE